MGADEKGKIKIKTGQHLSNRRVSVFSKTFPVSREALALTYSILQFTLNWRR